MRALLLMMVPLLIAIVPLPLEQYARQERDAGYSGPPARFIESTGEL